MGGDYITSTLTPLSTGVNLGDELLKISLGETINPDPKAVQYSGVRFFSFEEGSIIKQVPSYSKAKERFPNIGAESNYYRQIGNSMTDDDIEYYKRLLT